MNVGAKLAELAPLTPKFAELSCIRTCHNERTGPKMAKLTYKFAKRSCVEIIRNERT
jgi:hypothetical protein